MRFLKFVFTAIEPLKITDTGMSHDGEIASVNYIPGSTLKGAVVNALADQLKDKTDVFERIKKELLSNDTVFCNAYPTDGKRDLFPSPKGFYEDKTDEVEKKLQNVIVSGDFNEGFKRAKLGRYCFTDGTKIVYTSLKKSEALNINIDKKKLFRTDFLSSGYHFAGYIGFESKVSDETIGMVEDLIKTKIFRLGSSRSAGYGKIRVDEVRFLDEGDYPFSNLSVTGRGKTDNVVYMMLLSPMTMRNSDTGEICGIDEKAIEKIAGCSLKDHRVSRASTSVVSVSGINRTWRSRTPEYRMYDSGSVFRLEFEETPDAEALRKAEISGLGVGKNDGYGRVVFFADYENIKTKTEYANITDDLKGSLYGNAESEENFSEADVNADLKIIAAGIAYDKLIKAADKYIQENKLAQHTASNSQTGVFRSVILKYRYSFNEAESELKKVMAHIKEKEQNSKKQSKNAGSQLKIMEQIEKILDLEKLPGLEDTVAGFKLSDLVDDEELGQIKLYILEGLMIKKNREGK